VRPEGLGQLKNRISSSGIEPAAFSLVALCLKKHGYRVLPFTYCTRLFIYLFIYSLLNDVIISESAKWYDDWGVLNNAVEGM
jgi:hypothetical protein